MKRVLIIGFILVIAIGLLFFIPYFKDVSSLKFSSSDGSASTFQKLILFFGAFLFSEAFILPSFFLSGQGFWPPQTVILLTFLGSISADVFWYFFGVKFIVPRTNPKSKNKILNESTKFIDKVTKKKPYRYLLIDKIIYIPRFIIIPYMAYRKVPFSKLIKYDSTGTVIWFLILFPVGWLAGKGVYNLIPAYHNAVYTILFLVLFFIIYKVSIIWLKEKFIKRYSHK